MAAGIWQEAPPERAVLLPVPEAKAVDKWGRPWENTGDEITNRELFIKGVDCSYYYEEE